MTGFTHRVHSARTRAVVVLAAALCAVACDQENPPRAECEDATAFLCGDDNVCEGGRCVADRRWALWRLPRSAPGADNYEIRDDTVLDKTTSLIWERGHSDDIAIECDAASGCSIPTAEAYAAYCADLNIDGGGWRVPSGVEMTSLVDFTRFDPAIDPAAFPDTPVGVYNRRSFRDGAVGASGGLPGNGKSFVRCVKDSKPAERLADHYVIDGETVVDTKTQLRWVRVAAHDPNPAISGEDGEIRTPEAARAYCSALTVGGFTDWRPPWIRELLTLIDEKNGFNDSPGFNDAAFPGENFASSGLYFSATPYAPDRSRWWAVRFLTGDAYDLPENSGRELRCVRDEPVVVGDAGL